MATFLRYLIQLIIAPRAGWKDISLRDKSNSFWLTKGFYPLLAITSLSCFTDLFYHDYYTIGYCIQMALATFISYFSSYFLAGLFYQSLLDKIIDFPDNDELTAERAIDRLNTVALFSLSVMTLLTIIDNLLPFELPVINFLFAYVLFILYRGAEFAGVSEAKVGLYTIVSVIAVFLPPFILMWFFKLFFSPGAEV